MVLEWLYPLVQYFGPFNVFKYLTFRSMYAAVTALVIVFLAGPAIIKWLARVKFGQAVRSDGPESHLVKTGTPTMGGIFMVLAVAVSVLLWQDIRNLYTWISVASLVGFALIGFLDDWTKVRYRKPEGISARLKLVLQFAVAGGVSAALYASAMADPAANSELTKLYVPFFKTAVVDLGPLWIPFAMVYVVGWSNAVNISDGLDGLASGLFIIALIVVSIITYATGRADWSQYLAIPYVKGTGELTVFTLALVGACVGFLWYNAHPAQVFMGDVGSLALGGAFGVLGLILKKEILFFLVGGVFIMEIASTAIQVAYFRLTKGKRVFRMAPIHHHFELKGWKETKVVIRFWILGGVFAMLALSTLKIQ